MCKTSFGLNPCGARLKSHNSDQNYQLQARRNHKFLVDTQTLKQTPAGQRARGASSFPGGGVCVCVPAPVLFPLLPPRQPLSRQPAGAGRGAPGPAFVLGGRSAEHLGGGCTKELGPDPAAAHLPTATGSAVGPRRPGPPNTSGRGGKGLPATGGVCGGLGRFGGGGGGLRCRFSLSSLPAARRG